MRLRYETGIATLVQFVVGAGLGLISGLNSIITGCHGHSGVDCASNTLVSLILIILNVCALGVLLGIGYTAQKLRNTRLALILIGAEAVAIMIFLFDAKHATGIVDRLTNLLSFAIAAWVVYVAIRLARSGGRRVVSGGRRRPATKL